MPPYNPVNDFYFRNAQQYGQQMLPFPPQPIPHINGKFVTNIEEAKASMIDPLSYNLFLDSSNGKIYFKKLGNNGQSEFLCYSVEEQKAEKNPIEEINARLTNIEKYLGSMKNDKSVSVNEQSAELFNTTVAKQNESNGTTESAGVQKNAGNDQWKKRSRHEADGYQSC